MLPRANFLCHFGTPQDKQENSRSTCFWVTVGSPDNRMPTDSKSLPAACILRFR